MNWCGVLASLLLALIGQSLYGSYQLGVQEREWVGTNGYGWHTTAEEVSEGVDLTGKVALVTGGNSGLGFETCRVMALRGAHVIVLARSLAKAKAAIVSILAVLPAGREYKLTPLACDLGSLHSVDQAASAFLALDLPLHYLIANAGIMALSQHTASVDGYEMQIAVNHLGHFHLVTNLLDKLVASQPARVVLVSSLAHLMSPNPRAYLESPSLSPRPASAYSAFGSYGDSKLSQIIFARELNERYAAKGVLAYSLHPGIIETNLANSVSLVDALEFLPGIPRTLPIMGRSIPQGTATQVYAALKAPATEAGLYLSNCNVEVFGPNYAQSSAGLLENAAVRATFWKISEALVQKALQKA